MRLGIGVVAIWVLQACTADAESAVPSCLGAAASSPCCRAHTAWLQVESRGHCGGRSGSLSMQDASQCASAEKLCRECQKHRTEQQASIRPGIANTTAEGVDLSALTPDQLEMRCVPSSYEGDCKEKDASVFMVFLAGLALVILFVSLATVFDFRCLPFLVHRCARSFAAPRPILKASSPSPPVTLPTPLPPQQHLSVPRPAPVPIAGSTPESSSTAGEWTEPEALRWTAAENLGDPVVGLEVSSPERPPKRKPPPPLVLGDEEERRIDPHLRGRALTFDEFSELHADQILSDTQLKLYWSSLRPAHQDAHGACSFGAVDQFGFSTSPGVAIGRPVMAGLGSLKVNVDIDRCTSTIRSNSKASAHWPTRLARLWGLRIIFLYVASVAVFARLIHITVTAILSARRGLLVMILELLGCLVPYMWCALTSRPPPDASYGVPHRIGYVCWRIPRFTLFVLATLTIEIYSATATAWAVTGTSCNANPFRAVMLYCLGIPVVVARTYSALLAIRLQEGISQANRRVLPAASSPKKAKVRDKGRSPSQFNLTFSDISSIEPEADASGSECRRRTPTRAAHLEEGTGPNQAPDLRFSPSLKQVVQKLELSIENGTPSLWKRIWCPRPYSREFSEDPILGPPSPMSSPGSSQSLSPPTLIGRLRRWLRVRSTLAVVLSLGLFLALAFATASVCFAYGSDKDKKVEKLPSSCVTAQNGTATCAHFESLGQNLWDASVNDFLSGSADTQEDCCSGCDGLPGCQGWMFEHMARSCTWIRFLEEPCVSAPGDLKCRCLAHHGMTFGFKPTSQIVWVQRGGTSLR